MVSSQRLVVTEADTGFFKGGGSKLPDIIVWVVICNTVDLETLHDARFNSLSAEFSNVRLLPKLYSKR